MLQVKCGWEAGTRVLRFLLSAVRQHHGPAGATSYEIDRRATGGGFIRIAAPSVNSFSDTTVTAGQSYLYRVRAANASGTSGNSASAIATTMMFTNDPLTAERSCRPSTFRKSGQRSTRRVR